MEDEEEKHKKQLETKGKQEIGSANTRTQTCREDKNRT
jgi:hypothetical protein